MVNLKLQLDKIFSIIRYIYEFNQNFVFIYFKEDSSIVLNFSIFFLKNVTDAINLFIIFFDR